MNRGVKSGEHLRIWRIALGISQEDFVEGIISESYYSNVERGKAGIKITHLLAILKKNGISLADFLSDLDEEENTESLDNRIINKEFLNKLQLLLPVLDRLAAKKEMDKIFSLSLINTPELEAKCAQVVLSYLKKCYQDGFMKEVKQSIKYIDSLSNNNDLVGFEKLQAKYYQALIRNDKKSLDAIVEQLRKLKYEKFLEELPKRKESKK